MPEGRPLPALPPVTVIEPSPDPSRLRAAGAVAGRERAPDLGTLRRELKAVRQAAAHAHAALLELLPRTLAGFPGLRLWHAADAPEAVALIRELAGPTRLASLNRSSVVLNELRPGLRRAGFETYLRYCGEFGNLGAGGGEAGFEEYWSLPGLHERGLVESFAARRGTRTSERHGARDYVAVLGVNAVSAEDGTIFFLQHMANITKDLEQAGKVVLVVTPDKILEDREAAYLHARAMGIFGLETVLLDLAPDPNEVFDFERLPLRQDRVREVHLLLLDNGRTGLPQGPYSELLLCIDCRACARQCPIGRHLTPGRRFLYSPKNYLQGFLQGVLPPVDECLHCGRCQVECPVEIALPNLIWRAQLEDQRRHRRSLKRRLLDDPELLAKIGCFTAPLANWATKLPVVKRVVEAVAGIDRRAPLPTFNRVPFRHTAGGRHG